jgi:flagellar biosynthesis protein FlhF
MDIRTYRARSIQDALRLIREDLGPDAAVLHTREVSAGLLGGLLGGRQIEVTASTEVRVPSRLAEVERALSSHLASSTRERRRTDDLHEENEPANFDSDDFRSRIRANINDDDAPSLVDELTTRDARRSQRPSAAAVAAFTDLIDAGMTEGVARELLDAAQQRLTPAQQNDGFALRAELQRAVEKSLNVRGSIDVQPGHCKVVALVGPTGVGKTTTIAKLAANFRLKDKLNVGLITVDTYRIAAVEQLRTYAEIIDLPMEVVATPAEMRGALQRLAHLDVVLIDTAGRSPRNAGHVEELRSLLAEAAVDEIHLVLSTVMSESALARSVEQFQTLGATHLALTKLDEAAGLGALWPLLRNCELPVTYLTHGQSVPDDIAPAQRRSLAQALLGAG